MADVKILEKARTTMFQEDDHFFINQNNALRQISAKLVTEAVAGIVPESTDEKAGLMAAQDKKDLALLKEHHNEGILLTKTADYTGQTAVAIGNLLLNYIKTLPTGCTVKMFLNVGNVGAFVQYWNNIDDVTKMITGEWSTLDIIGIHNKDGAAYAKLILTNYNKAYESILKNDDFSAWIDLKDYIKDLSVSGRTITYTKENNITGKITVPIRAELQRSTAYAVGDIAFHDSLPSWAYLECVKAGTTAYTELVFGGVIRKQLIDDGTVMWKVRSIIQSGDVAGCIKMFAGNTIPDGYLLCDGSVISRTDYADLFAVISTIYGAGDGSTTFTLPNLIGRFIEGAATAGAYINAGLPNITGSFDFTPTSQYDVYHAGGAFYGISYNPGNGSTGFALGPLWKDISFGTSVIGFAANRLSGIYGASGTVQPNALTMLPIIKY